MSATLTGAVVPLIQSQPQLLNFSSLYQPGVAGSVGTIFPALGSIIINGTLLQIVTSVDVTLLTFTLGDPILGEVGDDQTTVISYGNDIFRGYIDVRTIPYRLAIDSRVQIYTASASTYQVVRYPDTPQSVVISRYYDATGAYVSPQVPLTRVGVGLNAWSCPACVITQSIAEDEELELQIYNSVGATTALVKVFAKSSAIINDLFVYQPKIVGISVTSSQMYPNGDSYVYAQQSLDSLGISALLTYQDGTTRVVDIDDKQCFLYGQEDFIAAYAGLRQTMLVKYFLSQDEASTITNIADSSISVSFNVVVVSNQLAVPCKLSVVPEWSPAAGVYVLHYFYYSTNHQACVDATPYISVVSGTYSGNNYINTQSFMVSLDLSKVDPKTYSATTPYTQNVAIKLQPISALVRYTLQDALSSPYVYGQDSIASRRPRICYDSTLNQYFIPSAVFTNLSAVLQSFYTNANPPYNPITDPAPPVPTHFLIRDSAQAAMITAQILPLSAYATAFTIVNGGGGNYVGSVVIVEFILQVSPTNNEILYGVPVDVVTGTYVG